MAVQKESELYRIARGAAATVLGIVFPKGFGLRDLDAPPDVVEDLLQTAHDAGSEAQKGVEDELTARLNRGIH